MIKKVIKLTEDELKKVIVETTREVLEQQEQLTEMARVGFIGEYEVYVHTDDGGFVPHVHVRDKATRGREFETCIQLRTNKYFLHGKYRDTMNSSMAKDFAEFMESPSHNPKYINNYEYAVDMWNDNNSSENVTIQYDEEGNMIIPDYRTIN